ncbi:MAG TPA: protein translocase subunit SecF [Polyangiaceae bacterium]|nr:protein translocase subunit SecF [Polyangiaceae bacterium]
MRLFSSGKIYNFMGARKFAMPMSFAFVVLSILLLLFGDRVGIPPQLGTDFKGGTEVELAFNGAVDAGEVRNAVEQAGFNSPDVIKIEDTSSANHYLIRVQEISTLSDQAKAAVERALCLTAGPDCEQPSHQATEVKFSPGGDKVTARFKDAPDLEWIKGRVATVKGISLRPGENNLFLQNPRDHKVEIQLQSKGDQLIAGLKKTLGNKAPDHALRSEWIGPRAGAQLRDAAVKSIAIALVFIMAYVAFRFDIRFAPGGVIALLHDAVGTVGVLILMGKELNLTTVAALLTIIGYSVNDTVVIYDRVRENMGKMRGVSFRDLINISTSEMLGRTILTNGCVQMCLLAFFVWGTGTLKDFALTLTIGMVLGTYSTIYIALPLTEALDRWLFSKMGGGGATAKKAPRPRKREEAIV